MRAPTAISAREWRTGCVLCRKGVKAPLAIGDVELQDGSTVKGFVGEAYAVAGKPEVSSFGGWRAYVAQRSS